MADAMKSGSGGSKSLADAQTSGALFLEESFLDNEVRVQVKPEVRMNLIRIACLRTTTLF